MSQEAKSEREQLELNLNKAIFELSDYFTKRDDPLQYEVNRLWREFDRLKSMPEFPMPESPKYISKYKKEESNG